MLIWTSNLKDEHNMMHMKMIHKAQSPCKYSWTQLQLNYTGLRLRNRKLPLWPRTSFEHPMIPWHSWGFLPETCPAPDDLQQYRPCLEGWREKLGGSEISSLALCYIMRPFFKDTNRPVYSCSLTFNCHALLSPEHSSSEIQDTGPHISVCTRSPRRATGQGVGGGEHGTYW